LRGDRRVADLKHPTGVAVIAVLDHRDIDVEYVAFLQLLRSGNAVADHMVERRADGFGETAIIERRRDRLLDVDDVVVADPIQFLGGDSLPHMSLDHVQDLGGQPAGDAHLFDFFRRLECDAHRFLGGFLEHGVDPRAYGRWARDGARSGSRCLGPCPRAVVHLVFPSNPWYKARAF
jgi:hypothetical protein